MFSLCTCTCTTVKTCSFNLFISKYKMQNQKNEMKPVQCILCPSYCISGMYMYMYVYCTYGPSMIEENYSMLKFVGSLVI